MASEGEGGPMYAGRDRFLNALSAFGVRDLGETEHYILFLTNRLLETERAYEEQTEHLRNMCLPKYGDERGAQIFSKLMEL